MAYSIVIRSLMCSLMYAISASMFRNCVTGATEGGGGQEYKGKYTRDSQGGPRPLLTHRPDLHRRALEAKVVAPRHHHVGRPVRTPARLQHRHQRLRLFFGQAAETEEGTQAMINQSKTWRLMPVRCHSNSPETQKLAEATAHASTFFGPRPTPNGGGGAVCKRGRRQPPLPRCPPHPFTS